MKDKAPVAVPDPREPERRALAYAHAALYSTTLPATRARTCDALDVEKGFYQVLPIPLWCAH